MGRKESNQTNKQTNRVQSISYIIWGKNLKFGVSSVAYHPWVTVTLTSGLLSGICIEPGAYLLYSLRYEFQICLMNATWDG